MEKYKILLLDSGELGLITQAWSHLLAHKASINLNCMHGTTLGLPITEITLEKADVSAVISATKENVNCPFFLDAKEALQEKNTDIQILVNLLTLPYRRRGVSLIYDTIDADINTLRKKQKEQAASKVKIENHIK